MVDDQDKALKFYTEVFGFVKKHDIPVGEYRWITVVSPEGPDDLELALEPNANPAGKTFQEALFKQGIPGDGVRVGDIEQEYPASRGARRRVHARADAARARDHRDLRRYLRQPHSAVAIRLATLQRDRIPGRGSAPWTRRRRRCQSSHLRSTRAVSVGVRICA